MLDDIKPKLEDGGPGSNAFQGRQSLSSFVRVIHWFCVSRWLDIRKPSQPTLKKKVEEKTKRKTHLNDNVFEKWGGGASAALSASNDVRRFLQLLMPIAPSTFLRFDTFFCYWLSKRNHFCRLLFSMCHLLWNVQTMLCEIKKLMHRLEMEVYSNSVQWFWKDRRIAMLQRSQY